MDSEKLAEHVDIQRWLINNGLISDNVKNQLFFCGSIAHKDVQAVELDIHPENREVTYIIYVEKALIKQIELYHKLAARKDIFGMWRFKRMLKKHGSLDLQGVLSKFVSDYLGPQWKTRVDVKDVVQYEDSLEAQSGQQTDKRDNQQTL